jgi:hypothetical protein
MGNRGSQPEGYDDRERKTSFLNKATSFKASQSLAQSPSAHNFQAAADAKNERLERISKTLADLPCRDPPPGPGFYAIRNPIGDGNAESKLQKLNVLTEENIAVVEKFFVQMGNRSNNSERVPSHLRYLQEVSLKVVDKPEQVRNGCIYLKSNRKTEESIREKASRASLKMKYPQYGIEHIRDACRFKCVVNSVYDAFTFLNMVATFPEWGVLKFDIDKYIEPKAFGWRFLGADLRMKNGQLVELYVVFKQMDSAKKIATRKELSLYSNHMIYEQWRKLEGLEMQAEEKAEFERDAATSRRIYNMAFFKTLEKTTYSDWCALFTGFHTQKALGGVKFVKMAERLYLRTLECRGDSHNFRLRGSVAEAVSGLPDLSSNRMSYSWMDSTRTKNDLQKQSQHITPLPTPVRLVTVEHLDALKKEVSTLSREVRESIAKNEQDMLDSLEALINFYRFKNNDLQAKAISILKTMLAEMEDIAAIEALAYIATPKCINDILAVNSDYHLGQVINAMSFLMNLASVIVLTKAQWSTDPRQDANMKGVMRRMADAAVHNYITSDGVLGLMAAITASYLIGNEHAQRYQNLLSHAEIPERLADALKVTLDGEKVYGATWKIRELVVALAQICYGDATKSRLVQKRPGVVRMLVDVLDVCVDELLTVCFALRTLVELAFLPAARVKMYALRDPRDGKEGLLNTLEGLASSVSRVSINAASNFHAHDRGSPALNRAREVTCELARIMLYVLARPLLDPDASHIRSHAQSLPRMPRQASPPLKPRSCVLSAHVSAPSLQPSLSPVGGVRSLQPSPRAHALSRIAETAKDRRWSVKKLELGALEDGSLSGDSEVPPYAFMTFSWNDPDRSVAEDICDELERRCQAAGNLGINRCTRFENEPDDPTRVLQEIDKAELMVLFVSRNYQESYNCRLQAELAEAAGKPIVFVELMDEEALMGALQDGERKQDSVGSTNPREDASAASTKVELGWLTDMMKRSRNSEGKDMNLMLDLTNKDSIITSIMSMFVSGQTCKAQRKLTRVGDIGYFQHSAAGVHLCDLPRGDRPSPMSRPAGLSLIQERCASEAREEMKEKPSKAGCGAGGGASHSGEARANDLKMFNKQHGHGHGKAGVHAHGHHSRFGGGHKEKGKHRGEQEEL